MLYLPEAVLEGRVVKLGRTQLFVLAALERLGGRSRFAAIVKEYLELMGLDSGIANRERYKNRVWQALRRLVARGLVGHANGVYWLSGPIARTRLFVENFRGVNEYGKTVQVWSKRDHGYALPLEEALELAAVRGVKRVVQIEIDELLGDSKTLDSLGVSIIKLYKDKSPPYNNKWKLEVSLENPPLLPDTSRITDWVKAFLKAKLEARRLTK
ncbi:hypothetical protein apy_00090 [Aeropyrum pernix]|uniref:Uncharacterized protein n=1 Tax=Aeropyrum pernix TaxID=56636 RepID=A0A401H7A8_AERPX|nr:hypothetical protein apy_00090 [Aeropyrum pernix]